MERVYFEHQGNDKRVKAVDCFVKCEDPTDEQCGEDIIVDYVVHGCIFIDKFLQIHPGYKYVGSTDWVQPYGNGNGMNLYGWKKIDTPIIDEDEYLSTKRPKKR